MPRHPAAHLGSMIEDHKRILSAVMGLTGASVRAPEGSSLVAATLRPRGDSGVGALSTEMVGGASG